MDGFLRSRMRNPGLTGIVLATAGTLVMVPTLVGVLAAVPLVVSVRIQGRAAREPMLARLHVPVVPGDGAQSSDQKPLRDHSWSRVVSGVPRTLKRCMPAADVVPVSEPAWTRARSRDAPTAAVVVTNAAIAPLLFPARTQSAGAAHQPRVADRTAIGALTSLYR